LHQPSPSGRYSPNVSVCSLVRAHAAASAAAVTASRIDRDSSWLLRPASGPLTWTSRIVPSAVTTTSTSPSGELTVTSTPARGVPAGEDGRQAARRALRRPALGRLAGRLSGGDVHRRYRRLERAYQDVAVGAGEVHQRPVQCVPLGPGGPGLLPALQVLERGGGTARRPGRSLARTPGSESGSQVGALAAVQLDHRGDRLRLDRLDQRRRRLEAGPDAGEPAGYGEHRLPAGPCLRVAGQPPGAPDVPLRGGRGPESVRVV